MTYRLIVKLMVLVTMSLSIIDVTIAEEAEKKSDKVVEKETSNILTAASRKLQQHSLGLGLGQTFLMGNFQSKGDDKITVDMFYAYTASYSFDMLVNYHSSSHEYRNKRVNLRGLALSIKARMYEFDAFSPFVLAGLGFYQPQIEKNGVSSDVKNTFGVNAGAGAELRLNQKFVVGVLGQVHFPFDVKQDETETVRGSYFKLLLTGMYLF